MKKYTPLIILLIISMILPTVVLPAAAATQTSLDYSDPSSPVKVEMSASELLEFVLGTSISEVERNYLDTTFGNVLSYSEFVPQKRVETVYDFGTLSVSAEKYEYTAEGGKVSWIPKTASVDGNTIDLSYSAASGKYEGKIEGLSASSGAILTVSYTCELKIDSETANYYASYTYEKATELWKENDEYVKASEAYEARQKYLAALDEYNVKKQAYDKYVSDKDKYDKKLEAFEKYESDLAEYKTALAEYKAAKDEFDKALKEFNTKKEAYENYLAEYKIYEDEMKEYQLYLADIERFSVTLEVLDSVYTYDSQGRQLYALLTGGTVDYVLKTMESNMHLLAGTNISEVQVRSTGKVTATLQGLLDGYADCSTKEEKVQYYKKNYSSLLSCFTNLSDSLYYMFHDPTAHSLLYKKDEDHSKFYKFMHMLAHLHVVETGLNDSVGRNEDWYVDGEAYFDPDTLMETHKKYGIEDLLEGVHVVPDKNTSNPANLGELPDMMFEPFEPPVVKDPGEQPKDPGLSIPVEPDEVKDPGDAPEEVKDPGDAPEEVKGPDTAPELLHHTAEEKSLIEAIDNGTLKKRAALSGKTMTLTTKVTKTLVLEDKCIVTFYDFDGVTELYSEVIDKGDKITYGGEIPVRAENDKSKYEFEGWKNDDGELVTELGTAEEQHIDFYASYKSEIKTYKITWVVNGVTTVETYPYGSAPTFKGELKKVGTVQYTYSFAGWSTPLAAVTGDATYEAVFAESLRTYLVTWNYGKRRVEEVYKYGDVPYYKLSTDKFMDGQYIYEFAGWNMSFAPVTGNVTYTALFNTTEIFAPDDDDPEGGDVGGGDVGGGDVGGGDVGGGDVGGGDIGGGESPDPSVKVELEDDIYKVTTPDTSVKVNTILMFAEEYDTSVTVYFEGLGAAVVMNDAMVSKLISLGCHNVNIYNNEENTFENALGAYSVTFSDKNGEKVNAGTVTLRLELSGKASESTKAYTVGEDGALEPLACIYEGGAVTVKLSSAAEVVLRNEYKISASKCENGVLSTDKVGALAGETVKVSLAYSEAYELVFIKVVGVLSGEEYELSAENTFVMPEEDVTVSAEVKAKEYTVKFVVDGVVISEEKYKRGETVAVPEDPTKESDGTKVYTFIGWSPAVTMVSEDATYTAEFSEAEIGAERPTVNTDRTRYNTIIAIAVTGVVVVLVGIPVLTVVLVKRGKKKKAQINNKHE